MNNNTMGKTADANNNNIDDAVPARIAPTSLEAIEKRVKMLLDDIPSMKDTLLLSPDKGEEIEAWARKLKKVEKTFELLMKFVPPVLYQWETDRTGNAQQNLQFLGKEVKSATELLEEATKGCYGVQLRHQGTSLVCSKKRIEIVDDGDDDDDNGDDTEMIELQEDDKSIPTTTSSGSRAGTTDDTPPKTRKTVERNTYESIITDSDIINICRDDFCDSVVDKRELAIVAISTILKAFKDYRKASANDVDSRDSGMML